MIGPILGPRQATGVDMVVLVGRFGAQTTSEAKMSGAFKKCLAEAIGTAFLVLIGCGSAAIGGYGAAAPVGILPIALAFGLAVTAMAYGIGPISGCHINPAVTVSMVAAGRMPTNDAIAYII